MASSSAEIMARVTSRPCAGHLRQASVADLVTATGMSRRWVYHRLRGLADAGRAIQTESGTWRATDGGPEGDAR